jgi:hypothetical protein
MWKRTVGGSRMDNPGTGEHLLPTLSTANQRLWIYDVTSNQWLIVASTAFHEYCIIYQSVHVCVKNTRGFNYDVEYPKNGRA